MRHLLHSVFFLPTLICCLCLGSCAKANDAYSYEKEANANPSGFWSDYCVVANDGGYLSDIHLVRDDGALLYIAENKISGRTLHVGDRLLVSYKILGQISSFSRPAYNVSLWSLYDLVTKPVAILSDFVSDMDPGKDYDFSRFTGIFGGDGIIVSKAWFGGEYINIDFAVRCDGSLNSHVINLVSVDTDPNNLRLMLYHSASGELTDAGSKLVAGKASFRLTDLLTAASKPPVNITMCWKGFDAKGAPSVFTAESLFTPWSSAADIWNGTLPSKVSTSPTFMFN